MTRVRLVALGVLLVALAGVGIAIVRAAAHDTALVSRATGPSGAKQNQDASDPVLSQDGRFVAFVTYGTNLDPADTSLDADVYVRDLQTNTTRLVSRATGPSGAKGNASSGGPSISADGRYVAFHSGATNLDGADTDPQADVYLRDLQANTTTLVSRANTAVGVDDNGSASFPSLSADGQHVAFHSTATNLDGADTDVDEDVFARDVVAATTELISRGPGAGGPAGNGTSTTASISQDGRYVAFQSNATNVSPDENEPDRDVFRRDTQTDTTDLVSRASGLSGAPARGNSYSPSISASGRHVAFESTAGNINPFDFFGDLPGFSPRDFTIDVFRRDMQTGSTDQASVADGFFSFPDQEDGHSHEPAISADGRHVAFFTHANTYVPDDTDTTEDVLVRDLDGGTTTLASRATGAAGVKGNALSRGPALSGDGRTVVYHSAATNLSPSDTDDRWDVFTRRFPPVAPTVDDTDPDSPANDNDPLVKGTAPAATTIQLFTTGDCSGAPAATGTAAAFTSTGIAVNVANDTTTTFRAKASDGEGASRCSVNSITYHEESSTPRPRVTATDPPSPADDHQPRIKGSAAAGSTVRIYTNATCTGTPAATGTAADFTSPGLQVTVPSNSTTTFRATAEAPGNALSPCSTTSVQFVEDSTTPTPPQLTATDPFSPANHNTPRIKGTGEPGATIKLYEDATCTGAVVATGSVNAFAGQGLPDTVADNSTTTYRATATDVAGHTSACSSDSITYVENSALPPPGSTFRVTTSADLTNDGCTPGHCTLREAIEASNAAPERNAITFDAGVRPKAMVPYGPLPPITDAVLIDGESASQGAPDGVPDVLIDMSHGPGGSYKTAAPEDLFRIRFDQIFGSAPTPRAQRYDGLVVQAPGTQISGVTVVGADGDAFVVRDAANTVIRRSATVFEPRFFIVNAPPSPPGRVQIIEPNLGDGIKVERSPNTVIGGSRTLDRNVLAYNTGNGVSVDAQSPGTLIEGNAIGQSPTDPYGTTYAFQRNMSSGVLVGAGAGANVSIGAAGGSRNVISGNFRAGVELRGGGNTVADNWIGPNLDSAAFSFIRNGFGVLTTGGANNAIGVPGAGNVISGNHLAGVAVAQETRSTRATSIEGNAIGPAPTGGGNLPNGMGVYVSRTDGTVVGGTAAGEPNTIHGNAGDGVQVEAARVKVLGSSTQDNGGQGIDVLPSGPQTNDAGDVAEPQNRPVIESATTSGAGTVITGHVPTAVGREVRVEIFGQPACDLTGVGEGLDLLGTATVTAAGNGEADFVVNAAQVAEGLNVTGTATSDAMGTSEHSPCTVVEQVPPPPVRTVNTTADDTDAGGCEALPGGDCTLREAIAAANAGAGTDVIDFAIPPVDAAIPTIGVTSALPVVTGPTVIDGGTQRSGTAAGTPDVELDGTVAGAGVVGLNVTGGNTRIADLVVNRFGSHGILLDRADDSRVSGSWVGLDKAGADAGNGGDGIAVLGARDVRITGSVVSGNAGNGIATRTSTVPSNRTSERLTVQASRIGTNVAGTAARANDLVGIAMTPGPGSLGAAGSIIGGASPELGNVVSANGGDGIRVCGAASKVSNNRVGTTADGMSDLGNGGRGIDVSGPVTTIIGGAEGAGNLVSGNAGDGIGGSQLAEISHNKIGTDLGGGAAIANGGDGIDIVGPGRFDDNLISGNLGDGVNLKYDFLSFAPTSISRNTIGRTEGGLAALGNAQNGIDLAEEFNLAVFGGDTLAGNVVASNGGIGLRDESQNASFDPVDNVFFDNGGLAIDRGEPGVTENDPRDRVGPANFPVLATARRTETSVTITGTLDSAPDVDGLVITFYSSPQCDPSGRGEGRTVLGSIPVDTDAAGHVAFDATLPVAVAAGHVVTATTGNASFAVRGISEFARCRVVPDVVVPDVAIDDATVDEGDSGTREGTMTVRLSRATTIPVVVDFLVAADTATPGVDVVERAGQLTVPAGATSAPLPVTVFGDTDPEGDELAVVQIDRASGGQLSESRGVLRIRDDDGAPPTLEAAAAAAQISEGDTGTTTVNVPVRLNRAGGAEVSVRWQTVPLEALSPSDFTDTSGELVFPAGTTERVVPIQVAGDTSDEGDERFFLALSTPDGVAITQPTGTVTIADDDAPDPPPPPPPPDDDPGPGPSPTPTPDPTPTPATPAPVTPARPPTATRPPTPPAPGVAARNGCLNGAITGVARAAQVTETDLCVEGPVALSREGCLRRTGTHRFTVALKTVRRTRKGRVAVPRRRSLVTTVRFTLNGKRAGTARKRPFVAQIKGSAIKPGVNVLKAAVRLRDPLKRGKVFRNRSLTFRFRSC